MQTSGSNAHMRQHRHHEATVGKLSPAQPAAVFVSSSEGSSWPHAALNPSKRAVMAHLLC